MVRKLLLLGMLMTGWWAAGADLPDDIGIRVVLFPIQEATLSAEVESRVNTIELKEGESFDGDEVLVELDDLVFQQRLDRARAAVEAARKELLVATNSYNRAVEMNEKNPDLVLVGKEEMDNRELSVSTAQAKLVAQESELALAEHEFDACRITAPFSGRLIKWLVNPHEYVRPGQALVLLIDDTQILAAMHLPSYIRPQLEVGQELEIVVDDLPGRSFTGRVHEIGGNIDAASRTFELKMLIDNPDGELIAGMAGRLKSTFDALRGAGQ